MSNIHISFQLLNLILISLTVCQIDKPPSPRLYFEKVENFTFDKYIISVTTGPTGQLIFLNRHSVWNVDINVQPPTKTLIAGSPFGEDGTRDGVGEEARFGKLSDVVLMNQSHILVTDGPNCCVRSIDLNSNLTRIYAGERCHPFEESQKRIGNKMTHRLRAHFGFVYSIIKINENAFIVSDSASGLIRKIENNYVDDLIIAPKRVHEKNFRSNFRAFTSLHKYGGSEIYAVAENGLVWKLYYDVILNVAIIPIIPRRHIRAYATYNGTTHQIFHYITSIIMVSENVMVAPTTYNIDHQIAIINLESRTFTLMDACIRSMEYETGNWIESCAKKSLKVIHVYGDRILFKDRDQSLYYLPLKSFLVENIELVDSLNTNDSTLYENETQNEISTTQNIPMAQHNLNITTISNNLNATTANNVNLLSVNYYNATTTVTNSRPVNNTHFSTENISTYHLTTTVKIRKNAEETANTTFHKIESLQARSPSNPDLFYRLPSNSIIIFIVISAIIFTIGLIIISVFIGKRCKARYEKRRESEIRMNIIDNEVRVRSDADTDSNSSDMIYSSIPDNYFLSTPSTSREIDEQDTYPRYFEIKPEKDLNQKSGADNSKHSLQDQGYIEVLPDVKEHADDVYFYPYPFSTQENTYQI